MTWFRLSIVSPREQVDNFSEFILESGAISLDIEDYNHGTNKEIIFGELLNEPQKFWQHNQINALFNNLSAAKRLVAALEKKFTVKLNPTFKKIKDEDWVKKTQKQFHPISIKNKVWIIPTWHDVVNDKAINLVLDPGLAFGTGSHQTTHLCIEWLIKNIKKDDAVLDYGCGSGILSICAKKLRANVVIGVDIDPQAIIASKNNAQINEVNIKFSNSKNTLKFKADIVVANILSSALKVLAPALASYCKKAGKIALSGILRKQEKEIKDIYSEWFLMEESSYKDEWVCLSGIKK